MKQISRTLCLAAFFILAINVPQFGQKQESDNGDGGPALAASVNGPGGIAVDDDGNVYIAEQLGHRVRRVDANTGIITTVAGNGRPCCLEENAPATLSSLRYPVALALDRDRNVYVAEISVGIRRVDAKTGAITTVVREKLSRNGLSSSTALSFEGLVEGLAINPVDPKVSLYVISNFAHIDRIHDGLVEVIPTPDQSISTMNPQATSYIDPETVAVDSAGNLLIADSQNCRIHFVKAGSNELSTVAGTGECGSSGEGGPAKLALIDHPRAITVDSEGNVYFAEVGPSCVRRIDAKTKLISSIPGTCEVKPGVGGGPSGLVVDSRGNLYFTLWSSNLVRRVDAGTGTVSTVAGNGLPDRHDWLR